MADGRVLIAFDDTALAASPTWIRVDETGDIGTDGVRVSGIDIRRGRQTEFDVTETSTATVTLRDRNGVFDPANSSSPYFGELDGKQIMLQLYNPVTETWVTQFRGHIEDYNYSHRGSQVVSDVTIDCVCLMDYLAGVKMIPGLFGDTVPASISDGTVFYEDTDFQTRVTQILTDAGLPTDRFRVFTGNVDVQETNYDPDDTVLVAIRDALDAEFPGIANGYTDKLGRFVCHGRLARFDPDNVALTTGGDWNFTRWKAGDGAAILADSTRAQIRPPLGWARGRTRIINAAIAYPRFPMRGTGGGTFTEADIPGQISTDATSVTAYGYRSWEARDLITLAGTTTGNDAKTETGLYAQYYTANYAAPQTRIEALTFKSINPNDDRASASWALLAGCDVSDIINLRHDYPGGVGLNDSGDGIDFYVEGSDMSIRPAGLETVDMVELTVNVSPAAYYLTDVFAT